ncbi:MAG: hypothetical protein LBJ44_03530 [Propionibacteriaceae bacterium]|jgi:hypothetical protein|nr:hypothetical protein [Propionibacteriaceae bacterium]
MKRLAAAVLVGLTLVTGCSSGTPDDPSTWPGWQASHRRAGSVLPLKVAGFSALGATPGPAQDSVTYTRDTNPFDLVVVTLSADLDQTEVQLSEAVWYGVSRCGWLDRSAQQSACVSVLLDGLMTAVGSGEVDPPGLANLANAILDGFA